MLIAFYQLPLYIENTTLPVSYHPASSITACSRMKVNMHYNHVIMGVMASQITSLTIVYSTVYSGADQREHQSSASLAFVRGIHRLPVKSPPKGTVTRKMFPFDDVTMVIRNINVMQNRENFCCSKYPWTLNDTRRYRAVLKLYRMYHNMRVFYF